MGILGGELGEKGVSYGILSIARSPYSLPFFYTTTSTIQTSAPREAQRREKMFHYFQCVDCYPPTFFIQIFDPKIQPAIFGSIELKNRTSSVLRFCALLVCMMRANTFVALVSIELQIKLLKTFYTSLRGAPHEELKSICTHQTLKLDLLK